MQRQIIREAQENATNEYFPWLHWIWTFLVKMGASTFVSQNVFLLIFMSCHLLLEDLHLVLNNICWAAGLRSDFFVPSFGFGFLCCVPWRVCTLQLYSSHPLILVETVRRVGEVIWLRKLLSHSAYSNGINSIACLAEYVYTDGEDTENITFIF